MNYLLCDLLRNGSFFIKSRKFESGQKSSLFSEFLEITFVGTVMQAAWDGELEAKVRNAKG